MTVSSQGLLPRTFIEDALTQEVHALLSLAHAREILQALDSSSDGRTARWIDVNVIGESGSAKTAYVTLNRLARVGWAQSQGPKGSRVWTITERGRRALAYARQGDSIGNAGVGVSP